MEARALSPQDLKKMHDEISRDINLAKFISDIQIAIKSIESFNKSLTAFQSLPPTELDKKIKMGTYGLICFVGFSIIATYLLEFNANPQTAYNLNSYRKDLMALFVSLSFMSYELFWKSSEQIPMWKHHYLSFLNGKNYDGLLNEYESCSSKVGIARDQIDNVFSKCSKEFAIHATPMIEILNDFLEEAKLSTFSNKTPKLLANESSKAHAMLIQAVRVLYFSKFYNQQNNNTNIKFSENIINAVIPNTLHFATMFKQKPDSVSESVTKEVNNTPQNR